MKSFLLFVFLVDASLACTVIGVGSQASSDGSVMIAHTDDSSGMGDPRLVRVPARDWPKGSLRPVYLSIADHPRMIAPERAPGYEALSDDEANLPWATPLGSIPQVEHTYAYWDVDYGLGNEHALVLAESTCSGKLRAAPIGRQNGTALFGIEELSKIALERCRTARCAVQTMGELAEEFGYYGGNSHLGRLDPWPGLSAGDEAEALALGDATGEMWVFHILPGPGGPGRGAVWAAQRFPADSIVVIANMFVIRQMRFDEPESFLASRGLLEVAVELGFWEPDSGPFDFTAAFSGNVLAVDPTGRKQLVNRFYSGRRIWRIFDLVAPGLKLDPDWGVAQEKLTYPQSVTPERKLSVRRFFELLRDHYEGTPFDMTVGAAAGPYGTPNRWGPGPGERQAVGGWERAVSMHRTLFSFVAQARPLARFPAPLSGVAWWAEDSPHASCFCPFYLAQDSLPDSYTTGNMAEYSRDSAWWASQLIKRFMDLNFQTMRKDVGQAQRQCEDAGAAMLARADAQALALLDDAAAEADEATTPKSRGGLDPDSTDPDSDSTEEALAILSRATNAHADWALQAWHKLFAHLLVRYKNGYSNEMVQQGISREHGIGYPAWWLRLAGYDQWQRRVQTRADEADARRASGQPPQPSAPATSEQGATADAGAVETPAPLFTPTPEQPPPRLTRLVERFGMAFGAIGGAVVFFALGVVGGHRLDRISRRRRGGLGSTSDPLLPSVHSSGALGRAGRGRGGRGGYATTVSAAVPGVASAPPLPDSARSAPARC